MTEKCGFCGEIIFHVLHKRVDFTAIIHRKIKKRLKTAKETFIFHTEACRLVLHLSGPSWPI